MSNRNIRQSRQLAERDRAALASGKWAPEGEQLYRGTLQRFDGHWAEFRSTVR